MATIIENKVEQVAFSWFADLDYLTLHGPDIASGEPLCGRDVYPQLW